MAAETAREGRSIELFGADASAYLPHLAVDCVVFGFHDGALRVLLVRWKGRGRWSLPGGFVLRRESLDQAAARVLELRTGLEEVYLEQFHTFGSPDRPGDPELDRMFDPAAAEGAGAWLRDRIVAVGYYALVDWSQAVPQADGTVIDDCQWWDVRDYPELLFDHCEILEAALCALRAQLATRPVGIALFPETFTLPELQQLYSAILDRPLDRRNFQKRMLAAGVLERVGKRQGEGAGRAPYLYRFHPERYRQALDEGSMLAG